MSFRAKCPACGRKQSLDESQIGHTTWCAACGHRFLVEWAPPEPDSADSSIPDLDFPTVLPEPDIAAPPPPAWPPTAPPTSPIVTAIDPAPATPLQTQNLVQPPPIVTATKKNLLVPLLVSLVVVLGIAVVGSLIAIIYLLNRPPTQTVIVPAATPVIRVPAIAPTAPKTEVEIVPQPVKPDLTPATLPAPTESNGTGETATINPAPMIVQVPPPPPQFTPVHARNNESDLDEQIGKSINQGVNYLLDQFASGKLRATDAGYGVGPGLDALAVYALLQAGEATHDVRLGPNSTQVAQMLDALKSLSMDTAVATYSHSLRAAALGVYHREADKQALRADCTWLIGASSNGAYTYTSRSQQVQRSRPRYSDEWDNSNSQYGALGVWASLEAGVEVPNSYWKTVEKHWLDCRLPDGEWSYHGYGDLGRMSMTVAGITTLLVAEDQLDQHEVIPLGHEPYSPALLNGLNWLEAGKNSVDLPAGDTHTYALFGLERAALASGFKYFGTHDWYRELAKEQLTSQENNGSWADANPIVDTAYTLLFLSRGRHPIFMNKLRFDGSWSNRPRDIANLSHYATTVLERPLNWQVVSLKSNWTDWMDSPVLYIASHEALNFTDDDCAKLRAFAENGGLIFTHADGDTPAFNKSIAELSHRLFPQYPLTDLPATHPIFSTLYKFKPPPRLQGISNGSRLLLVHSPTDLNKAWQQRDATEHVTNFQMGINIFIYAAGKANLRNKLKTPLVADAEVTPILTSSIAELKYPGQYNPEPAGLPRFAKLFLTDTSVKLNVTEADPAELDPQKILMAHLTGTAAVPYTLGQLKSIHDYVDNGGILLIDPCGASPEFLKSMVVDFLPHAFPQSLCIEMHAGDPILAGTGAGMTPVTLKLRPYRTETDGSTTQPIQYFTLGKGMVVFSTVDLSTGFLGTSTWGVNGYEPASVYDLARNTLLYSLEKPEKQ